MPTDFNGSWSLAKHGDIAGETMEKMGIPVERRPELPIKKLNVEIVQDGDKFTVKSDTTGGTNEYEFVVGSAFETHLVSWLPKMKVTAVWEGDKLVLNEESGFKMVREILEGQMVTTISKADFSFQVFFNKN